MTIEHFYPTGRGFSQIVTATGNKHVFISGQVAFDLSGKIVGIGDIAAQTEQIFAHLQMGLTEIGATFDDLVRMTIYVVDYTPEKRDAIQAVRDKYIARDKGPASTLVGVSCLVHEDLMIEIEVQAVIDD